MDSKVILFIAALIVAVIYLWVDNNRRRRERIEKKLESSWGNPSTRKITDDEMKVIVDNAKQLSHEADKEGISRFMYGAAVRILSLYWEYGECLRKWHNKD